MSVFGDTRNNPSVLLVAPANQSSKVANLDGYVINPGVQSQPEGIKTCDGMWGTEMNQGKNENFTSYMNRKCLYDKKTVDGNGKVHPAGSLKYPISNDTLRRSVYIYPNSPYPSQIPLMSHGFNLSALMQARANAIRNDGTLQANAKMFDQSKRTVKNQLMMGL